LFFVSFVHFRAVALLAVLCFSCAISDRRDEVEDEIEWLLGRMRKEMAVICMKTLLRHLIREWHRLFPPLGFPERNLCTGKFGIFFTCL